MLTLNSCLQPNTGEVAAKVMDGEAILINITSGTYHSLDGVGAFAWELIERGFPLGQIAGAIGARCDVEPDQVEADLLRLGEELLRESLVTITDASPAQPPPDGSEDRTPYEPPTLNTYRDMSDLLALDPPMPGLQEVPWGSSAA